MAKVNPLMIRYFGADRNRYHVIQQQGGMFWTGDGWSKILDCAKLYCVHRDAQRDCVALQQKQYKGLPLRAFRVELTITLAADDVEAISHESLAKYIADAVRIDVENSVFGDGPVEGSLLLARIELETLEEIPAPRERL